MFETAVIHHWFVKCFCGTTYCPVCDPDHSKLHEPIVVHHYFDHIGDPLQPSVVF